METTTLELHNNEWLSDALRRGGYGENIPTNVILDKTLTGVGATYCEIHAKRNSIIIEPNVPVIQCKLDNEEMPLEGVYSEVRPMSLRKYLTREDIPYKKILTTPESFYKIIIHKTKRATLSERNVPKLKRNDSQAQNEAYL